MPSHPHRKNCYSVPKGFPTVEHFAVWGGAQRLSYRDAFDMRRCLAWFRSGYDTRSISTILDKDEPEICRMLDAGRAVERIFGQG
jgi:hypothetical protein